MLDLSPCGFQICQCIDRKCPASELLDLPLLIMEGNYGKRNYLGVRGLKSGRWQARIRDPSARALVKLGTFNTVEEATLAYDEAALKYHKDRAKLNFPDRSQGGKINYRGVYQRKNNSWVAEIYHHKLTFLGTFSTPEAAATAYDRAALKWKGSRARLNFPEHVYGTSQDPGSQSSTGPLLSPPSQGDGQNHEPDLESFQQDQLEELDRDGAIMNLLIASIGVEGNVADGASTRTESTISEKQIDPSSQAGVSFPTSAVQEGGSVHHGGQMMVKVYKDDIIIKFELSFPSTKLELEEKVAVRLKLPVGSFDVRYQDEDNEWISITCDEDLDTCINTQTYFEWQHQNDGCLSLESLLLDDGLRYMEL